MAALGRIGENAPMANADFIEEFPGVLSPEECAALVARFEASGQATPGRSGSGVDTSVKLSRDITISRFPEWREAELALNRAMFAGLLAYARKYPQFLLSPFNYQFKDEASGELRRMRADDLRTLDDDQLGQILNASMRPGTINLQHYADGVGGYPHWHCESSPLERSAEFLHRTLLWSIYLNDGFEAGETEFLYQERKVAPRTGTLLLAPTAFTHTHRGNRPVGGDKYIATSWVLFKRAEQLFAEQA
jgi:hypothetical protein